MKIEQLVNPNRKADIQEYYKTVDGIKLPIHIFCPENYCNSKKYAAVICIHGGSWRGRKDNSPWDSGNLAPVAKYFASRGAIGVTISYRNFIQPGEARLKNGKYPELLELYEDCKDAIRYVRKNAEQFGVDLNKIAVLGDSAGGHLTACLATLNHQQVGSEINAAIACNAIMDLIDVKWIKYIQCGNGQDEAEIIKKAREVSPLFHIPHKSVPMLVMHGLADKCVDPRHSIEFYTKMQELGNRCEIELFPNTDHAFIVVGYTASDEQIVTAMQSADHFLISLGFLSGEPTIVT